MKSLFPDKYLDLYFCLLKDSSRIVSAYDDWQRDYDELCSRAEAEGISFLTKTLPRYFKHLLSCLETGAFTPVAGFKHSRRGPLPLFLGGLVKRLFTEKGEILTDRDPAALEIIYQITGWMYKTQFGFTEDQAKKKQDSFAATEAELTDLSLDGDSDRDLLLINADALTRDLFKDFTISEVPKQGPGAVSRHEKGLAKYDFDFVDYLDDAFPFEDWFYPSSYSGEAVGQLCDDSEVQYDISVLPDATLQTLQVTEKILSVREIYNEPEVDFDRMSRSVWDESWRLTARSCLVEKDSRGPRMIHCEPKEHLWLQQAIGESIKVYLERHPLTTGHVNFTDQSINRGIAAEASLSGEYSTIDLEDASDRVSMKLVRAILPTKLVRLLEASRSERTLVGDELSPPLAKFAGMGSACCFPVESVVFWALSVASIIKKTGWDSEKAAKCVFVYGDDIIVTRRFTACVLTALESCGLKVNYNKTFTKGPFRESCGIDAIDGANVTPVRLRKPLPLGRQDFSALVSYVETATLLYHKGFWLTAQKMREIVEAAAGRALQLVPTDSGLFGLELEGNTRFYPVELREGLPWRPGDPLKYRRDWDEDLQGFKFECWRIFCRTENGKPERVGDLLPWLARRQPEYVERVFDLFGKVAEVEFPAHDAKRIKKRIVCFT